MAISVFDLFKIGIGPSSSHTVGPMIAARKFILSIEESKQLKKVNRIKSEMYGSLGATGKAHGTPKAVILGFEEKSPIELMQLQSPNELRKSILWEKSIYSERKRSIMIMR